MWGFPGTKMPIYSLDYETTSACDISRGAYRYAADPSTQIVLFAIAEDDKPPVVWRYDNCEGVESKRAKILLKEAVESGSPIRAFNAQFELAICHYVLERQLGIPCPKVEQFRCTQAMSRRAAAPESLAESAIFFGLGDQKNPIGKALIGVFSDQNKLVDLLPPRPEGLAEAKWKKLKRPSASPILETPVPWDWSLMVAGQRMTVREAWEMFAGYCRQDVVVEQALAKKLHKFELTGDVLDSFLFDMRMNLRGVPVNVPALRNAQQVVETIQTKTGDKFTKLTGLSITQNARLVEWLSERGYKHDNLRAGTVDQVLENPSADLTPDALEALRLRSLASFAALKKIPTMIDSAGDDGRVRGTTQWHAARTGRAGGRIIQPQNFKKSTIGDSEFCYDLLRDGFEPVWFEEFWDSPLEAIASSIRHFIQPAEGMVLDADYTGVEARITPWLAGDTAKLDRILSGIDPYKHIATLVFKVPYEAVTKEQRTISKPIELGCCFGVGGKGLMTALALPPYNVKRTRALCNEYVKTYRDNHPETVQAWRDIEDAARSAINHPGSKFTACDDKLTFVCGMVAGIPYLVMRLPSGRRLYYPHPKVKATFKKYEEDEMVEEHWKREKGGYWIDQVSFYGKLRESANWGRVGTWGSRLFENAVQAIGADLLNYGCTQAEKEGYEIFMIVHDQALAHDTKPLDGFIEALCRKQPWAENFPLEASGAIHPFYLKD